jgi:elongation factor 1-beta
MGEVAVVLKVMPADTETDLDQMQDAIRSAIEVEDLDDEEVAFGLTALKVSTIVRDDEGGTDAIEAAVRSIAGVRSVEVEDMQRL